MTILDVEKCRSAFPALKSGYLFADNAGGSQCLKDVVDRISDYLLNTNVQLGSLSANVSGSALNDLLAFQGADYSVSVTSTQRVAYGAISTAELINASSPEEIIFGSSSTMLVENLARAMDKDILDTEELVITGEHEGSL